MNIHLSLTPLISLIAGILILLMPKLLNFIVALYLILVGVSRMRMPAISEISGVRLR